jgi:hypothetical protein
VNPVHAIGLSLVRLVPATALSLPSGNSRIGLEQSGGVSRRPVQGFERGKKGIRHVGAIVLERLLEGRQHQPIKQSRASWRQGPRCLVDCPSSGQNRSSVSDGIVNATAN